MYIIIIGIQYPPSFIFDITAIIIIIISSFIITQCGLPQHNVLRRRLSRPSVGNTVTFVRRPRSDLFCFLVPTTRRPSTTRPSAVRRRSPNWQSVLCVRRLRSSCLCDNTDDGKLRRSTEIIVTATTTEQ